MFGWNSRAGYAGRQPDLQYENVARMAQNLHSLRCAAALRNFCAARLGMAISWPPRTPDKDPAVHQQNRSIDAVNAHENHDADTSPRAMPERFFQRSLPR